MKFRFSRVLLAIYDLVLSIGAIGTGILMLQSNKGIFTEFPKEWITKLPFDNWVVPGIIIIIVFGFGNLIAFGSIFLKKENMLWIVSSIMSITLLFCLILQCIVLKEWYMPDNYYFIISMIQLFLSIKVFMNRKYFNRRL